MYGKGQRIIHARFGEGIIEDTTDDTYRVRWDRHRTDGGRDWSHVDHSNVQAI